MKIAYLLPLLFLSPAAHAAGCDKPVAFDSPKFDAQLKKQEYGLVVVGESRGEMAEGKEGEVEFESRGVVFSMGDIRDLVPKSPNDVVTIKAKKMAGAPAIEKRKLYMVYLQKDKKGAYVLDPCSHTHIAKGFMVNDVQAEQGAIHKAYGVNIIKETRAPTFPDKKNPTAPQEPNPKNPANPLIQGTPPVKVAPGKKAPTTPGDGKPKK